MGGLAFSFPFFLSLPRRLFAFPRMSESESVLQPFELEQTRSVEDQHHDVP
jgi:hypothetical protein